MSLKKFFIVNDYKDLISGKIIPQKVLDYIPASTFMPYGSGMGSGMGSFVSSMQPVPVQKFSGLTIPLNQPGINSVGLMNPYPDVTVGRAPLFGSIGSNGCGSITPCGSSGLYLPPPPPVNTFGPSTGCGSSSGCGSSGIYLPPPPPVNTFGPSSGCGSSSPCSSSNTYGPPIIKLTPMMNSGLPATINIISDTSTFTMSVPYRHLRSVVNEIYLNSRTGLDATKPEITFRIITPTNDLSLMTTYEKMLEIVKNINTKYSNVLYRYSDGREAPLGNLLSLLSEQYERKYGRRYMYI